MKSRRLRVIVGIVVGAAIGVTLGIWAGNKFRAADSEPKVKMLIVYYSHTGNAKFVAEHIQSLTGADVYELKPTDPYPEDFGVTVARVGQEKEAGVLPELSGKINNLADYDVIFLGTPNWYGTLSMPMLSFLNSYDLSGKTIVPFITFGRGGLMNTITDLNALAPNATILEAFGVSSDNVKDSQPDVTQWLERIGILK